MPFDSFWVNDTLVVRWNSTPDRMSMYRAASLVLEARREIQLLAIVPAHVEPPSKDMQRTIMQHIGRTLLQHARATVVFEGSGLMHSVKLSLVSGMIMVLRANARAQFRRSLHDALVTNPPPYLRADAGAIAAELRRRKWMA